MSEVLMKPQVIRYKVTIEQVSLEETISGKEWRENVKDKDPENPNATRNGYTPEIKVKKEVSRVIYEQTLERVSMKKVIEAVNTTEESND